MKDRTTVALRKSILCDFTTRLWQTIDIHADTDSTDRQAGGR